MRRRFVVDMARTSAAGTVSMVLGAAVAGLGLVPLTVGGSFATTGTLVIMGLTLFIGGRASLRPVAGELEVGAHTLSFGGRALTRTKDVCATLLHESARHLALDLRGSIGSFGVVHLHDRADAEDITRAIGVVVPRGVISLRVSRLGLLARTSLLVLAVALAMVAAAFPVGANPGPFIMSAALYAMFTLGSRARLEIGRDGVRLVGPTGDTSVAYADLEAVHATGMEIVLERRRKQPLRARVLEPNARLTARAIVVRLGAAIDEGASASADITRPSGDARAWIRKLRAAGAGAHLDPRTAPLDRERLLRVVEGHGISAEARAAAAVALAGDASDDERTRLRIAAHAIVSPRLRVAIESAADGATDEDLAEALADLDEIEPAGAGFPVA